MNKLLVITSFLFFVTVQAHEWVNPNNKKALTCFYQGMNNSQVQGAKYTGSHGFTSPTTQEHIVCSKSIDIINEIWVKPEIDEVNPAPVKREWLASFMSPNQLLTNVWQYSHELIAYFANKNNGIEIRSPHAQNLLQTIGAHSLTVSKINIAQEGDIENHRRRFESLAAEHPDSPVIFMGVSRGAATTFQSIARLNKENPDQLRNTRLIKLEGCPDSIENVACARHPWLLKYESMRNVTAQILSKITSFKRDGPSPLKVVADFPQHIPTIFITSAIDTQVPARCTKNLVKKLVEQGHKEVYLLELKNSSHTGYMCDNAEDLLTYTHLMHALYKNLNLPFIPEFAEKGEYLVLLAKQNAMKLLQEKD